MIDGRDFQARYWASDLLTPIPFLVELRGTVLARSHTRCPKWRFKLAPDLALQVQPRLGERRDRFALFKCTAIQGEDLSADHFDRRHAAAWHLGFLIEPAADGGWQFHPRRIAWPARDYEAAFALRARVLAELRSGRLDYYDAALMFGANCLICGKGLTDPASMARRIGRECARSTRSPFGSPACSI
jgi:hypothetical protein